MKRILLAYDGSEPARRALGKTIQLATAFSAHVGVISVVPSTERAGVNPWDVRTLHADELLEARSVLRQAGIEPELFEPGGDPARTIERVAADGGYDTIVMGTRQLSGVTRALQGSVSSHVASHASSTVVITR